MKPITLLLLAKLAIMAVATTAQADSTTLRVQMDPRETYLRQDAQDSPQVSSFAIPLEFGEFAPGDVITFRVLGAWSPGPQFAETSNTIAVFSADERILPSTAAHRIPGAISCGRTVQTGPSAISNSPTDIPEDFIFGGQSGEITVRVPQGAKYVFIGTPDAFYSDNTDADGDYYVEITDDISDGIGGDRDVQEVAVSKFIHSLQLSPEAPAKVSQPFGAGFEITAASPDYVLAAAGAQPGRPFTQLRLLAPTVLGEVYGPMSEAEGEALFPAGQYSLDMFTINDPARYMTTVQLSNRYPNTPRVLNGGWYSDALQFRSDRDFSFAWNAFENFQTGGNQPSLTVFNILTKQGQLAHRIQSHVPLNNLTLPADTLNPGELYIGQIIFYNSESYEAGPTLHYGLTGSATLFLITPVDAPPRFEEPLELTVTAGQFFSYLLPIYNFPGNFTATNLPEGLTFDPRLGAIGGIVQQPGARQIPITATNTIGTTSGVFTLNVLPAGPLFISSTTYAAGATGKPFSFKVRAENASPAARFGASALPAGLTINAETGEISGTPTEPGRVRLEVTVVDGSASASGVLELSFSGDRGFPAIVSADALTITVGQNVVYKIEAPVPNDAGTPTDPTTFQLIGDLPVGLTFDQKTGTIAGKYGGSAARHGEPAKWHPLTGGIIVGTVQIFANNSRGTASIPVVFSTEPSSELSAQGTLGQQFTFQLITSGNTTIRISGNLPAGLRFDPALRVISGVPQSVGDFEVTLVATNHLGTIAQTLKIKVQPPVTGPVVISGTSVTGRTGTPFRLQVLTSGGTRLSVSGLPDGLTFDPATGLITGSTASAGSADVHLVVDDAGSQTSSTLQLTFSSDPALPVITSPSQVSLVRGEFFTYRISAPTSGTDDPVIFDMAGTLPAGLNFDRETGTISGTLSSVAAKAARAAAAEGSADRLLAGVQLFASNSKGTTTLPLVFLLAQPRVVNISTRLAIGTDENVLIGGFIVGGSAPKKLIIRGIAPSLKVGDQPVAGAVQDPVLQLFRRETLLQENDNWRDQESQTITDTGVAPTDDREAAIVAVLEPGDYTAVVSGKEGQTGIGLIEVYDLGAVTFATTSDSHLVNISTRGFVQKGDDVMIGGFIASGGQTRVIVRALGPSLGAAGLPGALEDTTLDFVDGNGEIIASNDDWSSSEQAQQIRDTTIPPKDDREAAVVATLNPGAYTAIVRGKDDATGVGLVEVYVLP